MTPFNLRSLLLAAFVLSNCITWTASRHHYTHNVSGHRSRHRRQGAGLFLSASYVLPGGEGPGWGEWGVVSPCSRTCGGGVASQKRICLQIGPDGQPLCSGGDTKYFSCQTQDCPAGSKDFREQQCSEFDDLAFREIKYKWIPYTKALNPCELNCMPHGERFYYRHRTKVVDGTRCNDESFDVCVNGTCEPVGCDMMLGSTAREDKCRECRGNGANCHTTSGTLDTQDIMKGYNDMLLIPEGATSIVIEEMASSSNYLALRAKNGTYYLNGDYHIDFPRSLTIAGALWTYERSQQGFAAPDKLRCLGPTNEPLYLALLLQDVNVGIAYEYSVPHDKAPPRNKRYNWVHEEFTPCSAPCGGGFQTRNVSCRSREELELVDEGLCDREIRPPTNQTCNTDVCDPEWTPGPWGKCSKRCGKGGTRSREVQCKQIIANGYPSIVDDKSCFDLLGPKPELFQECNENATCPKWFTGPWKPCDKLCDEGKQTRRVVCYQKNGRRIEVLGDGECEDEKPMDEQPCLLQLCAGVDWVLSDWSGCDTCLSTVRTRTAICATEDGKVVNDSFCSYHDLPKNKIEEPCDKTKLPPCESQWYATQWTKCSVDCGKGIQTRQVFCGLFDGTSVLKVGDDRCAGQTKYNTSKDCEIPKEKCPSQWYAGPWSRCDPECGPGEKYRTVMCLQGGKPATNCNRDVFLGTHESCNAGPCNKDGLLAVDSSSAPIEDEYEDCAEDEEDKEEYPEEGLDADDTTRYDSSTTMLSDSPTDWSSTWTAEHESTFDTESTLASEEFLSTITKDSTGTDFAGADVDSTDTPLTSEASGYGSTTELSSTEDSTEEGSGDNGITESSSVAIRRGTDKSDATTTSGSEDTEYTTSESENSTTESESYDSDYTSEESSSTAATGETSESSETESDSSLSTGSESTEKTSDGTTDSEPTDETGSPDGSSTTEIDETAESKVTSDTDATPSSPVDKSTESSTTEHSTEVEGTTESDSTLTTEESTAETGTETGTTETATDSTEITETTNSDITETTDITETDSTETTETSSAGTTEATETGSTEATETAETGSTEVSGTIDYSTTEVSVTESTEVSGTSVSDDTEPTEAIEHSTTELSETGSTDASETSVPGSTEPVETTEYSTTEASGTGTTEITSDSGSTESAETTEAGSTTAAETTETGTTELAETTDAESTTTAEPTEAGSTITGETTEAGTTEVAETTEVGTTEATETTETGSTEPTELDTQSTEFTVTEETTTEGLTETTEEGSNVTSEGTESFSESSTTEAATSSSGLTRWDLTSTVVVYTTQKTRVCRPKSCLRSKFGCCPDMKTPARGPFDEDCPKPHNCTESFHGCCPDGVSPSQGPGNKGCPVEPCEETLFGCCESDNKTPAEGNDQEGCPPPPPPCLSSKYGCCKDGETEATGPEKEGCPETTTTATEGTEETEQTETTTTTSPTETADQGCAGSEFGCCFDNKTAATGPELQGCSCETSQFNCCPDGVTPAQGPDFEGCEKSCNTSAYGCCPDGKTPAHGVDQEGCCLLYAFGCCPDNYKPADGPHMEGCGCQFSPYGCCPDNVTVANGPEYKGCGCQYTQHGCCPDRHTEASGPEFEGCMCHTYQFGCCPDGVTVARGPKGQGCYCQQTTYGCCGDEQTPAKGRNKEGCDCATSKYGCCLDGITEATGPKFQNCTDAPQNRQAVCNLKFERGECHNYSVTWYYDTEYGGCSRFWYGGCDGNGNRFSSKEDCEDTCVNPPPKDACKLPPVKGACLGYNVRWYYDDVRETCSNFVYGGCLGNNNNFESRELCQTQCEPEIALDLCGLAIERGSCAGNYPRWGYNQETRHCEEFIWGGCEGNSNRFHTEAACMLRCNPPGKPQPECSEPQEVGTCNDTEALWSFSLSENRCVPFYFTGCGGNGNKFQTRDACEESCPSAYVPELCTLPAATGECDNYTAKWYFDTKDQRCRPFYFGGCGGNGNKFNTEEECSSRCTPPPTTTTAPVAPTAASAAPHAEPDPTDLCFLEIDAGPCNQWEPKWAYDTKRGKCVAFQFGGCGGNQNHFDSEDLCTRYCKPTQDICQLPMLSGPCDGSVMSWFYDATSDSCSQFTYGGCEGNENRFESREECEHRCKTGPATAPTTPSTTTMKIDSRIGENIPSECTISPVLEECTRWSVGEIWYYDQDANACAAHNNLETGDECRTTGVFYSQEACERSCGVFRNIDVCNYQMEAGPCQDFHPKYHYNSTSRRCEEFAYGGCLGGPNRFSSEQECEQICMSTIDPCTLPPEPGNCINRFVMWYYDEPRDQCYQFAYGGCGGNENKFETRELCEGQCRKQPAPAFTTTTPMPIQTTRQPEREDECRTPVSLEPCGSNITVFYYDERTSSCRAADIGNCGYHNSYKSEEECERRCGAFRGLDVCQTRLDPGPCKASIPKFYFDAASGSCNQFAYGGCRGGANRFSTSEECEEVCGAAGPARACLQEVSTGEGCGAVPERRWHYDVARADCLVFAFQGCGGNENNFVSYDECAYYCRVATPETEESRICRQYADECAALMTTCSSSNFRTMRAPEGCKRCACEERVSCDQQRRECDALRCSYGIERTTGDDGCEKCKCFEDPCLRSNCSSGERCVQSAYRVPVTQEVQYSAHCVREIETNEILECQAYIDECSRISCPYGVQKIRTASGCERCACVREEVDCAPLRADCDALQCAYGLQRARADDGCERCTCLAHPCSEKVCAGGERCVATPFRDPVTGEAGYSAVCRTVEKPGDCPADVFGGRTEGACRVECHDDADCRGVLKCCARGCSQLCLESAPRTTPPPSTTHRPEPPQAPQASPDTEPQVAAAEGGKATLRCLFHGNPPPRITWQFGEIIIDSDVDRYRLLSDGALEIVSLYRNDSGVYICVASNELGSAQQEITLQVNDPVRVPAGIAGDPGAVVTGELDQPVTVRCLAYGYPPPSINWYRGHSGESMVPFSNALYEARGYDLLIRHLTLEALGDYVCHVYNGEGRAATWQVTVQAYQPYDAIIPDNPYLVTREGSVVAVTPRAKTTDTTTTTSTTTPEPDFLSFTVPVQTKLLPASTKIPAGAQLSLPCEVDGFPEPQVHWTKDNVVLAPTDRMWVTGTRLTIPRALVEDSGVYGCHAANAYSSHTSTVQITVQEVYVPAKCIDNPTFANCALIVQSRFCRHPYYSKFCCKSCVEAGQLDARDAEMQSDEPFRRK